MKNLRNDLYLFIFLFFSIDTVIPRVTRHLLSNPVFSCITLAACMEIAVVAGFAAFLGKYLEQQFNLTTSSANQLLGRRIIILPGWRENIFCCVLQSKYVPYYSTYCRGSREAV